MATFSAERHLVASGASLVAGVDEAGRGCLAGPVVAAAVILPPSFDPGGIADSKALSARMREALYSQLIHNPNVAWAVGICDVLEIDQLNILRASQESMRRAVRSLVPTPDHLLIDGLPVPGFDIPSTAIVGGDASSVTIAAASIIAKVTRDQIMQDLDREHPIFAFAQHKGYATALHLDRIRLHGITNHHRRSFRPVAQMALGL